MLRKLGNRCFDQVIRKRTIYQQILFNSTNAQPAVKDSEAEFKKQLKQYEELSKIAPKKARAKKPQRKPFVKNLLLGNFDEEILTYPQLEKEDIDELELTLNQVEKLTKQELSKYKQFDVNFLQNLGDYKLIGLQAGTFENGRECNISEYTKIMETLSYHRLRNNIIHNEQLGVQTLVKYGSENLKQKYLQYFTAGKGVVSFCMAEEKMSKLTNMSTKAVLSADKKEWILSGEKIWVVNGKESDFLIVFALTGLLERDEYQIPSITAFLVDKNSPGISSSQYDVNNLELSKINFKNTPVPVENIIGVEGGGEKMILSIMNEFRLCYGSVCTALSKKLVNKLYDYVIEETNDDNLLLKTDAVREKIGQIALNTYAMESMTFLTTGLLDMYENQDIELEAAIIKYYSSQKTLENANLCLNLIGTPALEESHWCNKLYNETLKYITLHETNDNLKVIIALMGLKYVGDNISEKIKMIRNPLFNAPEILKRMWNIRKHVEDNPKLSLKLNECLHPSLLMSANNLEYCVHRLKFGSEILLTRHGAEIINQHMDLNRLADCIINIYAMTAVLGRASRSYCIGLQHGDFEMLMANAFCNYAKEAVQYNIKKIYEGPCQTNDENYRIIAKRLIKFKGYFPVHPLSRNF